MTKDYKHPITPQLELVQRWASEWTHKTDCNRDLFMATRAAQWGANKELLECAQWLDSQCDKSVGDTIINARRSKLPSLKQQAIAVLEDAELDSAHYNILLRALEQIND